MAGTAVLGFFFETVSVVVGFVLLPAGVTVVSDATGRAAALVEIVCFKPDEEGISSSSDSNKLMIDEDMVLGKRAKYEIMMIMSKMCAQPSLKKSERRQQHWRRRKT